MAIYDLAPPMSVDHCKIVHPFFSKIKGPDPQPPIDTTVAPNTKEGECEQKEATGKHLAEIPETSSVWNHGRRESNSLAMGNGKGAEHMDPTNDLEVDPNHARRKRQRSSEVEDPHQMKLTPTGHIRKPTQLISPEQDTENKPLSAPASVSLPDENDVSDIASGSDQKVVPESATPPVIQPTRKILKLSGKGTLGSPKKESEKPKDQSLETPMSEPVEEMTPKKETSQQLPGRAKRKRKPTSLVVIVRYQKPETGKSVERILNGEKNIAAPSTKQETPNPVTSAIIKPPHPFFTKKPNRTSSESRSTAKKDEDAVISDGSSTLSTVPVKIKATWPFPRSNGQLDSAHLASKRQYNKHAPWPWQGAAHVRGFDHLDSLSELLGQDATLDPVPKQKGVTSFISSSENILRKSFAQSQTESADPLFLPMKLVLNNSQIQELVAGVLSTNIQVDQDLPMLNTRRQSHIAIVDSLESIQEYMSPWDLNRCETQAWSAKYAPTVASRVLQSGPEAIILRNWLRTLKINVVDSGKSQQPKPVMEKPKKKRKRPSDMDDFIVSESEDELDYGEMTDIEDHSRPAREWSRARKGALDKKSKDKVRTANTIVISGPSGCGKTAAVYAAAKELDFEIFEINSSSRRSGRDILDRIGDMAENHLVQLVSKTVANAQSDANSAGTTKPDTDTTRQRDLNAFLGGAKSKKPEPQSKVDDVPKKEQKQSLILFEEVDILFQEDKQFWATVLALAMHSKRPLVLTCNNEQFIPIESLTLHALLRFRPPPTATAVDYLLSIAAREGHLLQRSSVKQLFELGKLDLRYSITNLQFWCQMGVGDKKGGLDWMLDRWPPGIDVDSAGQKVRAISQNTFREHLDLVPNNLSSDSDSSHQLLVNAMANWDLSTEDLALHSDFLNAPTSLLDWEHVSESLSAADVFCRTTLRVGKKVDAQLQALDPTHPGLSDFCKGDIVEGSNPISSEPPLDFDHLDVEMASSLLLTAKKLLSACSSSQSASLKDVLLKTLNSTMRSSTSQPLTRAEFSSAFDALGEDDSLAYRSSASSCTLTSIDREFRVLTHDIAPYVRAIASLDLKVEAARAATHLMSVKRVRTTKAARSALEGLRREEMHLFRAGRKERWFGTALNLREIMDTGGEGWSGLGAPERESEDVDSVNLEDNVEIGSEVEA